jgi:cell division septum initiation protein DivIVA
MRYTPVELRHVKMGRALFGYRRDETNQVLQDVADSFEEVWCERGELADKLEHVEGELAELREREALLANTLVAAEKAATEAKDLARREAELIISEAHTEARSITRTALTERERLFAEARRVETLLRAALGMVEETSAEPDDAAAPAPAHDKEHWPRREDTREFQPIALPAPTTEGEEDGPPLPPAATEEAKPAERAAVEVPWEGRDFAWG